MRSFRRLTLVFASLTLVLFACDSWLSWDDVFKRSAVGPTLRGWTGGDGAISAELPGGRAFWIFGDSLITSYTAQGTRPQAATNGLGLVANMAFGNTIAVQQNRTSPAAAQTSFWARNSAGAVIPISSGVTAAVRQFFSKTSLGQPPSSPDLPMWPVGAECIDCNGPAPRLLLSFMKWRGCDPNPSAPSGAANCAPLCFASGASDGPSCHSGVEIVSSVIARLKFIDQAPSAWAVDGVPLEITQGPDPVLWGAAFAASPSGTLIFGRRVFARELVVARALDPLVASQWQFWHGAAEQWTASASTLTPVAEQIGAIVSVDKITRAGITRYLLAHGDTQHMLYARVSSDAASGSAPPSWPVLGVATPRIDLVSIEASLRAQQTDLINRGQCTAVVTGATPNWSGCGTSYHGLAHAHLALSDASGPLVLPTSYIVPYGPNPLFNPSQPASENNPLTGVANATYYRPKFTAIPLDKLRPWCSTDCWEGIVHDYARRSLTASPASFEYDVQQSARFYASLTRLVGAPSVRVEFSAGTTALGSTLCPVDPAAPGVLTCNVLKPLGAKLATVRVSGAVGDSFALRTHYAGAF